MRHALADFFFSKKFVVHVSFVSLLLLAGWQGQLALAAPRSSLLYSLIAGEEVVEGPLDPSAYAKEEGPGPGGSRLAAIAAVDSPIDTDPLGENTVEGQVDPATLMGGNAAIAPLNPLVAQPGSENQTKQTDRKPIIYKIKDGDTIAAIAAEFNVSIPTVLWANGLNERTPIRPGSNLVIARVTGVVHNTRKGDTLSGIADKYNVKVSAITEYNGLRPDAILPTGEQITVPDGVAPEQRAPQIVPRGTRLAQVENSDNEPTPPPNPQSSTSGFQSPVDRAVLSQGFGYGHGGADFARVGIDRSKGNLPAIYATAAGVVEFAGWHGGYGYLVVLNHGNGWRTYSAHLSKIYAKQGQSVGAGAAIGQMGSTGHSSGPHLHLEMIHNGARQNPCAVLTSIC